MSAPEEPSRVSDIVIHKDEVRSFVHDSILLERIRSGRFTFVVRWKVSVEKGDDVLKLAREIAGKIGTPLFVDASLDYADGIVLRDRSVVKFGLFSKFELDVWSRTQADAAEELKAVQRIMKPHLVSPKDESEVGVTFWHLNAHGDAKQNDRMIACPLWGAVRGNYSPCVQADMESLIAMKRPWEAGKIIFWSGIAGSGKTYGIRSLIRQWRGVVEAHYIMDPEKFFGDAHYMHEAVMSQSDSAYDDDGTLKPSVGGRLFIIEDMPDLILTKSRSTRCAEMARLLNLSDGFIGQGVGAIFLLTTNEEVYDVDPAFLRDGRILMRTAFEKFAPAEARTWLTGHGASTDAVGGGMTLAELYAITRGRKLRRHEKDKTVKGFAVGKA